jgi:hypothetical protein
MVKHKKDGREFLKFQKEKKKLCEEDIWAYKRLQAPTYSLGGYSHRERWSRTRWNKNKSKKLKRREDNIFEPILKKIRL